MSTASPALQTLARQLLASALGHAPTPTGDADQAVRACAKLRGPLTKLAGAAGFASLLARALVLAQRQAPALAGLRVGADGVLERPPENPQDSNTAESARQGGVILVTELLGLLVTFIGTPLTLRLVQEAWPEASIKSLTSKTEGPS